MRKAKFFLAVAAVMVTAGFLLAFGGSAQAKMVPKVDNFILFPDQSGSMYMTHGKLGVVKMVAAKDLMMKMNERIPELGYQGALDLFAPWQVVAEPAVYDRASFGAALEKIPSDQGIFNRLTPMGPGVSSLDSVLSGLRGKTAVIVVSDGGANKGADPVAAAQAIHRRYPDVCFHVISFAEDAKARSILKKISEIGGCGVYAEGTDLLADDQALNQFVKDVFYAEQMEPQPEVIVLRGIHFDFDKSDIKPEWQPVLDEGAEILKKHPQIRIIIEGHTDSIGTEAYNQKLSERRAKAVYDYFVAKGVEATRMKAVGYGELKPKADNATKEGRAINRRVEIKVVQ
ncbi:OmpA-OmpF porin, OOP family [Desulfacinum hydrothermale DSM 13146]|uniref:OmpA-OmpF porin, OOP family n=1 Tax=Desulfacinum hydrothermale DSM 13146 TaxID=1121390 RepID=A0A1W1XKW7_9BACT|nr:OmpA family protein [Desulfacinum hydrothermale]SMC24606.1 OmpA-OmpF porin, OOP family [Desulfacinum hydrothermale DSM 13146]